MLTSKYVSDFKANVKEAITLEITSEDLLKSKCLFLSWHAGCGSEQWYIKKMQTNFYFSLIKEDILCKHQKNLKQKRAEVYMNELSISRFCTPHTSDQQATEKIIDEAYVVIIFKQLETEEFLNQIYSIYFPIHSTHLLKVLKFELFRLRHCNFYCMCVCAMHMSEWFHNNTATHT